LSVYFNTVDVQIHLLRAVSDVYY